MNEFVIEMGETWFAFDSLFNPHATGMRYTVQNHGFLALYRGLTPTLISAFPKAGIRFGSNAYFKKQLMDDQGKLTPGKNFLAGVGAGMFEERDERTLGNECDREDTLGE